MELRRFIEANAHRIAYDSVDAPTFSLRSLYPVTLGANVGTTISALLASLASGSSAALTVALVHTTFNIAGIVLFYPIPKLRDLPIHLAERMAEVAARRRSVVLGYVLSAFVIIPALGVLILR